jgi:hypothetical protein
VSLKNHILRHLRFSFNFSYGLTLLCFAHFFYKNENINLQEAVSIFSKTFIFGCLFTVPGVLYYKPWEEKQKTSMVISFFSLIPWLFLSFSKNPTLSIQYPLGNQIAYVFQYSYNLFFSHIVPSQKLKEPHIIMVIVPRHFLESIYFLKKIKSQLPYKHPYVISQESYMNSIEPYSFKETIWKDEWKYFFPHLYLFLDFPKDITEVSEDFFKDPQQTVAFKDYDIPSYHWNIFNERLDYLLVQVLNNLPHDIQFYLIPSQSEGISPFSFILSNQEKLIFPMVPDKNCRKLYLSHKYTQDPMEKDLLCTIKETYFIRIKDKEIKLIDKYKNITSFIYENTLVYDLEGHKKELTSELVSEVIQHL